MMTNFSNFAGIACYAYKQRMIGNIQSAMQNENLTEMILQSAKTTDRDLLEEILTLAQEGSTEEAKALAERLDTLL